MATKFLGAIITSSWSFQLDNGGSPETINITDGTYYLSGDDASDDLIKVLEDGINTALVALAGGHTSTVSIDADGLVSISVDAGTYTLTWTSSGTTLRDILRFTGTSMSVTSTPQTSARACRYFAHSTTATNIDQPTDVGRTSLSEADDGTITGVDVGPLVQQYRVKVRYSGPHRTSTANGYTEFRDLWVYAIKPGRKIRWYPDTTVTTAWAELTNPNGYHVTRALEPRRFTPAEVIRDFYGWYTTTFLLQVQP